MQIDYLADHMEFVPTLAEWHHREWSETTLELTAAELRTHTERRHVPTTFVAVENGRPIGSTSLLIADLDGWEQYTPWVASVFVAPNCRGRGIGRALVVRAVEEARLLGVTEIYLYTASKQEYYSRLGWQPFERAHYRGKEIVLMRQHLEGDGVRENPSEEELKILERLDALVAAPKVSSYLMGVAERVIRTLADEPASNMAWESLPLEIYGNALPPMIRSSWIFVLRAGAVTGAERHPNSHQRVMSRRGCGDLQIFMDGQWRSNELVSDSQGSLLKRWVSIAVNVWHQAVVHDQHWVVVSFHTAPAHELIEERPDGNSTRQRLYLPVP